MKKRISSRGIIFTDKDSFYAIFRRKKNKDGSYREYYVIPGGGCEEGETKEDNLIREMKEEFSVDVEILNYLGFDEGDDSIAHFFSCKIIDNKSPFLGGEESKKNNPDNYYEIQKINITQINKIDILSKDIILKAHKLLNK